MNNKMKLLLTLLGASLLQIAAPVDLAAQAPEEDRERALREEFPDELDRLEAEWAQRQEEMDRELEEWEGEQARRRDEEGENFDEEAYEFERGLMARRRELEERRMRQEEEIHQAYRDLDGLPPRAHDQEREKLERREQGRREALDAEFQALEDQQQQYWVQRQRSDMHEQEQDGNETDENEPDEGG